MDRSFRTRRACSTAPSKASRAPSVRCLDSSSRARPPNKGDEQADHGGQDRDPPAEPDAFGVQIKLGPIELLQRDHLPHRSAPPSGRRGARDPAIGRDAKVARVPDQLTQSMIVDPRRTAPRIAHRPIFAPRRRTSSPRRDGPPASHGLRHERLRRCVVSRRRISRFGVETAGLRFGIHLPAAETVA